MSFATNQVTVDSTAGGTVIAPARPGRHKITIIQHGTTVVWLGGKGVSATTGARLIGTDGAQVEIDTSEAIYGFVATGSQALSYIEHY